MLPQGRHLDKVSICRKWREVDTKRRKDDGEDDLANVSRSRLLADRTSRTFGSPLSKDQRKETYEAVNGILTE